MLTMSPRQCYCRAGKFTLRSEYTLAALLHNRFVNKYFFKFKLVLTGFVFKRVFLAVSLRRIKRYTMVKSPNKYAYTVWVQVSG